MTDMNRAGRRREAAINRLRPHQEKLQDEEELRDANKKARLAKIARRQHATHMRAEARKDIRITNQKNVPQ